MAAARAQGAFASGVSSKPVCTLEIARYNLHTANCCSSSSAAVYSLKGNEGILKSPEVSSQDMLAFPHFLLLSDRTAVWRCLPIPGCQPARLPAGFTLALRKEALYGLGQNCSLMYRNFYPL